MPHTAHCTPHVPPTARTAHCTYHTVHTGNHCNYLFEKEGPESALFGHVEANETGSKIDEDGDTLYRREGREMGGEKDAGYGERDGERKG